MQRQTVIKVLVIIALIVVGVIGFNMWKGKAATLPAAANGS